MKKVKNLKNIKGLLLDVDGIMTDGTLWSLSPGQWRRTFNIYDGIGIRTLIKEGYAVGIITGSDSDDIRERQKKLGVAHLYEGIENKVPSYEDFLKKNNLKDSEVAYMGDDLADIPILERVGFSVSVPTAMPKAKKAASYITKKEGGKGAVREVCDIILDAKNKKGKK